MPYLGAWHIGETLTFYADTIDPTTAESTDADSLPTYRVYRDAISSTLLTGTMAVLDDANTTGWYAAAVSLTVSNGFLVSSQYVVRVTTTVAGLTGAIHHTWQILTP